MGRARRLGLLFLPVVSPWARSGDRKALIALYEATSGADWAINTDINGPIEDNPYLNQSHVGGNQMWNVIDPLQDPSYSGDPCQEHLTEDGLISEWFGVHCEDPCYIPIDGADCQFGRITSIHLPANKLKGTIPPSLFDQLVNLSIVDFSYNELSGTIPTQVGKLRNLQMLLLGNNKLSGTIPSEINTIGTHTGTDEEACAIEDLQWPDGTPYVLPEGGYNLTAEEALAFNGTCPTHAVATMGLREIDVSANKITGMLPTTFGDLVNLQAVDVSNNDMLGMEGYEAPDPADAFHEQFYKYTTTIPTEMGMLKKIQLLKMDHSRFMRHMPTEIGNMRSLRYWDVRGTTGIDEPETNAVSGSIPTEFGRLKNLLTFNMENNTLSGTIPAELINMSKLERFEVPDNKLSGSIPNIFSGFTETLETWDTFNNKLTGDIPSSIGMLLNLEYLYIQNEHTDPIRNFYCGQRMWASSNGRKYNWQVIANDYVSLSMPGTCIDQLDVEGTFGVLSGDV